MKKLFKPASQHSPPWLIFRHGCRQASLYLLFAVTVLTCASLFAQTAVPGAGDEDSSQRVDESEESYRTRMELRDQRYRQQKRADMIYSTPAGTSKLDQLPEASREHIKQQLREMIIASRQWKPGEDVSDYPYEPSQAAQTDTKLRNQEREAWAEELDKYQQREAAAYANTQGGQDAQTDGGESGQGGVNGSAGTKTPSASQSQAALARKPGSSSSQEHESEPISTAGVAENALSFLQGNNGQPGASGPPADDTATDGAEKSAAQDSSDGADSGALPGSLTLSELAQLQDMGGEPGDVSGPPGAQLPVGSSASSAAPPSAGEGEQGESTAPENDSDTLRGTLNIDELKSMGAVVSLESVHPETGSPAVENPDPAIVINIEPGTLGIDELKHLERN